MASLCLRAARKQENSRSDYFKLWRSVELCVKLQFLPAMPMCMQHCVQLGSLSHSLESSRYICHFCMCSLHACGNGAHEFARLPVCSMADVIAAAEQMERRARLRKILATMDDEDERKAALPGKP